MKFRILIAASSMFTFALTASGQNGSIARPQDSSGPAAELREIVGELKKLRLDLVRVLVDSREQTVQQLERELRSASTAANSLQEQEKAHNLEIAEIDERLNQTSDPQERAEIEKARTQLVSAGPRRIEMNRQALATRQSELNGLLNYARQARNYFASVAAGLERELSSRQ